MLLATVAVTSLCDGHPRLEGGHWRVLQDTYGQTFMINAGQTITVKCTATTGSGSLAVEVPDPNNRVLWQCTANTAGTQQGTVRAQSKGSYTVQVRGQNSNGGSFTVSWKLT